MRAEVTQKSDAEGRTEERYRIVAGREVNETDISEAVELDRLSYSECYRGVFSECVAWAKANPDIYIMLRDLQTGKIVAYINVMPVTDECYAMLRNGDFIDTGIRPEMILSYDMPVPYCVYFSSVVIHPEYRNSGVFRHLFNAIVRRFLEFGRDDVFVKTEVPYYLGDNQGASRLLSGKIRSGTLPV